jgi:hypothetical protein
MNPVFQVLEVYRPRQRRGPVLVGTVSSGTVEVGSRLISSDDPDRVLEVIAVDMPTPRSQAEGRIAVVVLPDLGDYLRSGAAFKIVTQES